MATLDNRILVALILQTQEIGPMALPDRGVPSADLMEQILELGIPQYELRRILDFILGTIEN